MSFGENFAQECPRYLGKVKELEARGWQVDESVMCAPFDYRYPPGENTFVTDLALRVTELFRETGQKTVLACHSQGCLMTLHALRTLDQIWVVEHVHSLFSFAGQFFGCSDCLSWAFSPGWSWDPEDSSASPVDPTWIGEMALGLQEEIYADTVQLLKDQGALAMSEATIRYSLESQPWFQEGNRFEQERPIMSDGDGGDSSFMNRAPKNWTPSVACDMRELPGISHMEIITNPVVIKLLAQTASVAAQEVSCVGP